MKTSIAVSLILLAIMATPIQASTEALPPNPPTQAVHAQWTWITNQGPIYQYSETVTVGVETGCFGSDCGIPTEIYVIGIIGDAACRQTAPHVWEGSIRINDRIHPCNDGDQRLRPLAGISSNPVCSQWASVIANAGYGAGFGGQGSGIRLC